MARKKQEQKLELPEKYWIVSADLSLRRPGFFKVLVTSSPDGAALQSAAAVSVDNKANQKPHGQLLDEIMKAFAFFMPDDGIPVYFVREKAFNARASQAEIGIYKVVGVMDWLLYRIRLEWSEIYPVTVKKLVTGSGKSTKDDVAKALPQWLPGFEYKTDDESDAAAVAISFLIQNGVIHIEKEEMADEAHLHLQGD